jgi:hypothetical protein
MQRSIKDGSITFLRNSYNGEEGKPKNTLRTQSLRIQLMRFKHSRMHRDNRRPGIGRPPRGTGPSAYPFFLPREWTPISSIEEGLMLKEREA